MKAIVNGKILLKDRVVEGFALLYSDVIEGIVPMEQLPEEIPVIDADGGYISPGLIDLHIHGYLGCDVCDGFGECGGWTRDASVQRHDAVGASGSRCGDGGAEFGRECGADRGHLPRGQVFLRSVVEDQGAEALFYYRLFACGRFAVW